MPRNRSAIGLGIVLLAATWSFGAQAAELDWQAPAECPEKSSIVGDLEELIGQAISEAPPIRFAATVTKPADGSWRAELSTTGRSAGTRTLTGQSCAEVSRAAVVAMALVVNSDREQSTAVDPVPVPPETEKRPSEAEPAPTTRDQRPSTPLHPVFTANVLLDGVALPSYAFGFGVTGGIAIDRVRILLGGLFLPPITTRQNGLGGEFQLFAANIAGCYRVPIQNWATLLCGLYELGALRGEGVDVTQPNPETVRWNAVAAEALVTLPLSAAAELGLGIAAVAPLERVKFVLDSPEPVHELPVVGPRIQAGVAVIF